jgi:pimeloyl-ACP methyl ester carboxylesterase
MPFASIGPKLYYERHGSGEPLLLLTGFGLSSAIFEPLLERFTEHFECILLDNRGSGRSPAPMRPTSMPELAADASRLLEAIDVESAHVLGASFGGMIAQELAIRFPERVRGLVLGGTTPGGPQAVAPNAREMGVLLGRAIGGLARDRRSLPAAALFSERFRHEEPERVRELLAFFTRHRPRPQGVWAHWWASVYHDTVSRLGDIQAPTLVMHGELDAMAPVGLARMLVERIPDSELALVPGVGHAYGLEAPDASAELLLDWYGRRSPIGPGVARGGLAARAEPVTRALGLPIGALRTGRSLGALALGRGRPPA